MKKVFEIQERINNDWVSMNAVQFPTPEDALTFLEEHMQEAQQNGVKIELYRIESVNPTPMFKVGYRFKLPGYKHHSAKDLEMIITYIYDNGTLWKYHVGLIVAKVGERTPQLYLDHHCSVRTLEDIQYVDYCTSTEAEIEQERMK